MGISVKKTFIKAVFLLASLTATCMLSVKAEESASIGMVTFQTGDTRLERSGKITAILKGQKLLVGDRLLTGPDGHVYIRMVDNGFISVRPSARFNIQAYTYMPNNPSANRIGLLLEAGVVRTISGKAGEAAREHYRFNTPMAAIGLRGTDYVVQALPDATRVSVFKGAVTLSPFGPSCQSNSLSPCLGSLVSELAANTPHAYIEVRSQGGKPVIVAPENGTDTAPNKAMPPRPEELNVSVEHQLTNAVLVDKLQPTLQMPTLQPTAQSVTPVMPEGPPEIVWGRWSHIALQKTPTVTTLATDEREITFINDLFGLFRPIGTPTLPSTGVIGMNYAQGEAYLQNTALGSAQTLIPAQLSHGKLQLDFNTRQFTTSLTATAEGTAHALQAQGNIQFQGLLVANPLQSNMNLAGALSNNANEAGYVFDTSIGASQTLTGATRWKR